MHRCTHLVHTDRFMQKNYIQSVTFAFTYDPRQSTILSDARTDKAIWPDHVTRPIEHRQYWSVYRMGSVGVRILNHVNRFGMTLTNGLNPTPHPILRLTTTGPMRSHKPSFFYFLSILIFGYFVPQVKIRIVSNQDLCNFIRICSDLISLRNASGEFSVSWDRIFGTSNPRNDHHYRMWCCPSFVDVHPRKDCHSPSDGSSIWLQVMFDHDQHVSFPWFRIDPTAKVANPKGGQTHIRTPIARRYRISSWPVGWSKAVLTVKLTRPELVVPYDQLNWLNMLWNLYLTKEFIHKPQ